jgi:hypothetical protein
MKFTVIALYRPPSSPQAGSRAAEMQQVQELVAQASADGGPGTQMGLMRWAQEVFRREPDDLDSVHSQDTTHSSDETETKRTPAPDQENMFANFMSAFQAPQVAVLPLWAQRKLSTIVEEVSAKDSSGRRSLTRQGSHSRHSSSSAATPSPRLTDDLRRSNSLARSGNDASLLFAEADAESLRRKT